MSTLTDYVFSLLILTSLSLAQVTTTLDRIESDSNGLGDVVIEDIFGRRVNDAGIVLVDWEGYMANPAIQLFIIPPMSSALPGTVVLTSTEPRLYLDLPSDVGLNGPTKTIAIASQSAREPFYCSIFPDRDSLDEDHLLSVQFTDASGAQTFLTVSVHVVDQDRNQTLPFRISTDFSEDRTGFFNDQQKRDIILQAVDDWAYFVDEMSLDSVGLGEELTWIWNPDGFSSGRYITNGYSYRGFLIYVYGIHSTLLRSGGEASFAGGFQSSGGVQFPIRRSGGVEIETDGNYNSLGWYLTTGDDDWWKASNLRYEQNDLYSIARHEIGHALFFHSAHTIFADSKTRGYIQDSLLFAYHGSYPRIDISDHFNGEIDNASKKGVFGYEYYGDVPRRRWLITKLDLLCAQAIGYKIRRTSAFIPLSLLETSISDAVVSLPYADTLRATGGIPFYEWTIESGTLPDGLSLNSFTGILTGTPTKVGTFSFTVRVRDYDTTSSGVAAPVAITIISSTGAADNPVLPERFSLSQNYPNPFNLSTSIRFALPRSSYTTLKVYSLLGQEIETLSGGLQFAGDYEVRWNPSGLTSGVYLYRLEESDYVETKKMILLK